MGVPTGGVFEMTHVVSSIPVDELLLYHASWRKKPVKWSRRARNGLETRGTLVYNK